jgi:hypothetical protein
MKYLKIAIAVVLTAILLVVASSGSRGRPESVSHSEGGFTFEMVTVPKITEHQSEDITISVTGIHRDSTHLWLRTTQPAGTDADDLDAYDRVEMQSGSDPGDFFVEITAGKRGGRFYYYFEMTDANDSTLATFRQADASPFLLKYIGEVPLAILATHILFIFVTVFFVASATVSAIPLIGGGVHVRPMTRYLFWATVFCFLGGYPFGIPMNYYAFDGFWEGVPFGTDATDNKTQLLFVYLLYATLSGLGTLTGGRFGRDIYMVRTLGWVGMSSFVVMLFIYLIPHSIQFSAGLTYVFCYSWIAIVALLYLTGYMRSGRMAAKSKATTR